MRLTDRELANWHDAVRGLEARAKAADDDEAMGVYRHAVALRRAIESVIVDRATRAQSAQVTQQKE